MKTSSLWMTASFKMATSSWTLCLMATDKHCMPQTSTCLVLMCVGAPQRPPRRTWRRRMAHKMNSSTTRACSLISLSAKNTSKCYTNKTGWTMRGISVSNLCSLRLRSTWSSCTAKSRIDNYSSSNSSSKGLVRRMLDSLTSSCVRKIRRQKCTSVRRIWTSNLRS